MNDVPVEMFKVFEDDHFKYKATEGDFPRARFLVFHQDNGKTAKKIKVGYRVLPNSIQIVTRCSTNDEHVLIKVSKICELLKKYFEEQPEFRLPLLMGTKRMVMPNMITDLISYEKHKDWTEVKKYKKQIEHSVQSLKSEFAKRADPIPNSPAIMHITLIGKEGLHLSRLLKEIGAATLIRSDALYRKIEIDLNYFGMSENYFDRSIARELTYRLYLALKKLGFQAWQLC
jgi:hypothetical protein